jgi:glucosylceramidase
VKFAQAYAAEGITIHQVHVQNEPNSDQKFPSCLWTGELMRNFIRDYLGPAFREHNLDCEIWAGTIEKPDYVAWAHTILADPEARKFISGVGYQWAGQGAVQRTHASWPQPGLMQTENECSDGKNTWEYAGYVFDLLQHYITNGVNAYVYWNAVLQPTGLSTWGWNQNSMFTVDPKESTLIRNPEYYVMKHFTAFVRPGARRMQLAGAMAGMAVAFEERDRAVVVLHNPLPEPSAVRVKVRGNSFALSLPAESMHTVVFEH